MKHLIIYSVLSLFIISCTKVDNIEPKDNNTPKIVVPPPNDTTTTKPLSLVGQKWVVKEYRVGMMGSITPLNDTIVFNSNGKYTYNGFNSTYSFYSTGSVYNLTMNYTPFGNISGSLNDYNVVQGIVYGGKFVDISIGSSGQVYYLWMERH